MNGVEDGDGILQLVVDGALVALERVQGGDLHAPLEVRAAFGEPVGVGRTRAARDEVEQPGVDASVLVRVRSTMPVNSLGPRPPDSIGLVETWCQMCSSTPREVTPANRVSSAAIASSSGLIERHTVRQVVPSWRARPATEACSRRIWAMAQPAGPHREQRPRPGEVLVLLGERTGRALLLRAAPRPLAPHQPDRPGEAGHVDEVHVASAVAVRDHPARAAPGRLGGCLDDHPYEAGALVDIDHVEPVETDEEVRPVAVARALRTWARGRTP